MNENPKSMIDVAQKLIDCVEGKGPYKWELVFYTFTGQKVSVKYKTKSEAQKIIDAGFPCKLQEIRNDQP